jgi:hypothetical protein
MLLPFSLLWELGFIIAFAYIEDFWSIIDSKFVIKFQPFSVSALRFFLLWWIKPLPSRTLTVRTPQPTKSHSFEGRFIGSDCLSVLLAISVDYLFYYLACPYLSVTAIIRWLLL